MKRTLIGVLIVAASFISMPTLSAGEHSVVVDRVKSDTGGGGPGDGAGNHERPDVGAGRGARGEIAPSAPSVPIGGQSREFVTPDPVKPDNPTPPKDQPSKPTPEKATPAKPTTDTAPSGSSNASPTGSARAAQADRGWVTKDKDTDTTSKDAARSATTSPSPAPPTKTSAAAPPTLEKEYQQKVKAAQQAYFAVKIRYKMRTPRPRIQVPKEETSKPVVEVEDVVELLWDIIQDPKNPMNWVEILRMALEPQATGTSSELIWVDGPYKEEVELARAVEDLMESMPPDERREILRKWLEQEVWEAENKPYIAPPRLH